MLNVERMMKDDRQMSAMTGINLQAFNALVPSFAAAYQERIRERAKCEHAHAGIKRYSVTAGIYRNRKANFDDRLMLVSTGLWNFYLKAA
jgi:hypothetical protein